MTNSHDNVTVLTTINRKEYDMAPKNERLELRVDERLLNEIDSWVEANDSYMSRAEAVRQLITLGLQTANQPTSSAKLTDGDKIIIQMIADLGRPDNAKELNNKDVLEAIYGGHYWAIKSELTGLLHDHSDSPAAVKHVVDVLDMWSFLEEAWAKFDDSQKKQVSGAFPDYWSEPVFAGFDGNNESECMGIAQHYVDVMGRFSRFKGRSLNSHFPTREKYNAMYAKFKKIRPKLVGRTLSPTEMIEVLARDT